MRKEVDKQTVQPYEQPEGLSNSQSLSDGTVDPYAEKIISFGCPQTIMPYGEPVEEVVFRARCDFNRQPKSLRTLTRKQRCFLRERGRIGGRQGGGLVNMSQVIKET